MLAANYETDLDCDFLGSDTVSLVTISNIV